MSSNLVCVAVVISFASTSLGEAQQIDPSILSGPYLGQEPPDLIPQVFAPGFVSTGAVEFGCTFSPDGEEFYFGRIFRNPSRKVILVSYRVDSVWTTPGIAPFSGAFDDELPRIVPDGQLLFFTSNRPLPEMTDQTSPRLSFTVWVCRKEPDGWGEPSPLAPNLKGMITVSATRNNVLYTKLRNGPARLFPESPGWSSPENFTIAKGVDAGNIYVSPEDDFLLFGCDLPGFGMGDLWVSFHGDGDGWSEPVNLGPDINTVNIDAAPNLSPGGDYLFYTSNGDIKWVSSAVIEQKRPRKPQ
ncbi:MAG: PD40 domain-containing protein [Candidatus Zixiibacteriota bacterium]|nr:MAG: PD40 domain-containing protein [candidate division Zixibacteria bacterium]